MTDRFEQVERAQAEDLRSNEELVAAYLAGAAAMREVVAGMDAEALRARPIPGMWSTLEVVCHVVDCDQFLADRMKRTIGMERPLLVGVDASAYPETLHYHDRDLELQLRLLELTREQMAADLLRLDAEGWERTAVHTETGLVTVRQELLHTLRHLEYHVETVRRKRDAMGLG